MDASAEAVAVAAPHSPAVPAADVVELTGNRLTAAEVRQVALGKASVSLLADEGARARVERSAATVRRWVDDGQTVYGVTTGVGGMANVLLQPDQARELQRNLLHFHRAGVGAPLAEMDVRAAMLVRANSHLRGASGLRWTLIERLVRFLNEGVTPVVRQHGSIGASGDLTPLAAIAGAAVGLDAAIRVTWRGEVMPATEALEALGLERITLEPKEALAMMNGTSVSAGMAINCVAEMQSLIGAAVGFHALAVQALAGSPEPFDPFVHAHKPHPGQGAVAAAMRRLLRGSRLTERHDPRDPRRDGSLVQDRYSIRCLAQFLGPAVEAMTRAEEQLEVEINSTSDNPLIDSERDRAYHGGNFLGEHVAVAMDSLRAQIGLVSKHVDIQLALLMAPEFSDGLPPSLVGNPARSVNMGLKALQITANALMPLVVFHGMPIAHLFATHAEQFNQNVNSLSLPAAHLAREQAELARQHVAIALLAAVQAVDLRARMTNGRHEARESLSPATVKLYDAVRHEIGRPAATSRPLVHDDDEQILENYVEDVARAMTTGGALADAIEEIVAACFGPQPSIA